MKNKKTYVALAGFLLLALMFVPIFVNAQTSSSVPKNLSGHAWSSTIGWVSLSCENAGVCGSSKYWVGVKNNGTIEGYAWSSNVGWISFNSVDTNGCPSGSCQATFNKSTGEVSGWARALAGRSLQNGGWDGWIYLGQSARVAVNASGCAWEGNAWGGGADINSSVVGWLSFKGPGYGVVGSGEACAVGDPDLSAGIVVATPEQNGAKMRFDTPLSNTGGSEAKGVIGMRVQIALHSDASSAFDVNYDTPNTITNLSAGETKNGTYTWNNPVSGRHQVRVCVDYDNKIAESDEGNNCGPVTTFQVNNPPLSVSCVGVPNKITVGGTVTWVATVSNNVGATTYSWTGTDGLSGTGSQVTKKYNTEGTKTARVMVTAENATASATCAVKKNISDPGPGTPGGVTVYPAPPTPTADVSVSPTEILLGGSSTLSWASTGASSCTGTGFNTGNRTNGSVTVSPTNDATYQVQCGSAIDNATVRVLQPNITISVNDQTGSVRVANGDVVTVKWHAEDISSCDISGPGILVQNATADPLDGSANTTITARSVYIITCDAVGQTFDESVIVNIPPDFEEF